MNKTISKILALALSLVAMISVFAVSASAADLKDSLKNNNVLTSVKAQADKTQADVKAQADKVKADADKAQADNKAKADKTQADLKAKADKAQADAKAAVEKTLNTVKTQLNLNK